MKKKNRVKPIKKQKVSNIAMIEALPENNSEAFKAFLKLIEI